MKKMDDFFAITRNKTPSDLLVLALQYVHQRGRAIDIGGGALKDTRFLLEQGFDVTVIDKEALMANEAEMIKSDKLQYFVVTFELFDFPKNTYDVASAMFSLPFNSPETFEKVFERIKGSLKTGGIFCGHFFGVRDEWAVSCSNILTFHTREQVEKLLKGLLIILFEEEEKDGVTAIGSPKHWHFFNVIAQKKG